MSQKLGSSLRARTDPSLSVEQHLSISEHRLTVEVEDLTRIHELSLRLASATSLNDVLLDVLQTAAGLVEARLGSVQLVTPEGALGMIGQVGFGESIVDKFSVVRLDDCSVCADALKRKARVTVPNLRDDSRFSEIATSLRSYGAAAIVSTPVLDSDGDVLAMFSVYWLEEHYPTEREFRALDLCAELAGRHVERSVALAALHQGEIRQKLLIEEFSHRGKNLLSVIQAIANMSLSGERTVEEARSVLTGRLHALATTFNVLTDRSLETAQLHDIVSAGLKPYGERIDVRGDAIVISAKHAQTLALVFHELATNAVKYGALSVPGGRIEIVWDRADAAADGQRFIFTWSERHGPPAVQPTRKGFGSSIITSVVGAELNCVPQLQFLDEGFRYRLECAASDLVE